jgi:nucleoside phosphorylase
MQAGRTETGRICVLTILDEEFAEAQRILGATVEIPGTGCYRTNAPRLDVVLMQSPDRGNPGAQGAVSFIVEEFRPEVIVVSGIAGGIAGRENIALGDVVVPDYLHYWEFRKLGARGDLPRYSACDYPSIDLRQRHANPVRHSNTWQARIGVARPDAGTSKVITKPLVAGEKILSDPEHDEQRRVVARFTDAVAIDMESYGVAKGVHLARTAVDYNPLFLVVRGVSDLVSAAEPSAGWLRLPQWLRPRPPAASAEANQQQRDLWRSYAAAAAAAFASEVIDRILAMPDLRAPSKP